MGTIEHKGRTLDRKEEKKRKKLKRKGGHYNNKRPHARGRFEGQDRYRKLPMHIRGSGEGRGEREREREENAINQKRLNILMLTF